AGLRNRFLFGLRRRPRDERQSGRLKPHHLCLCRRVCDGSTFVASLKLIRLILTAQLPKQSRIILQHCDSVRMLGPERPLYDVQRSPIERLGLGVSPLRLVEFCQAVEAGRSVWMLWAERLLSDVQSAPMERLSLGVSPLRIVESCQVMKAPRSIWMLWAE